MNIQVLPNIFKKIGLFLFLLGPISHFVWGLAFPFHNNENPELTSFWRLAIDTLSLLGVIIFFLSKEKIEDELIKQIRLEAMSKAFVAIGIYLLVTQFIPNYTTTPSYIFFLQVAFFFAIYYSKKRSFDL